MKIIRPVQANQASTPLESSKANEALCLWSKPNSSSSFSALKLFMVWEKNLVKAWCYSYWNYHLWCKFIYSIPWLSFFVFSCIIIVLFRIEALFSYWRPCLIQFCFLRLQVCFFNNTHYVFDYFTLLLFCIFFFFFWRGVWRFTVCNLSISFMEFISLI